jgi:hypothetical protein
MVASPDEKSGRSPFGRSRLDRVRGRSSFVGINFDDLKNKAAGLVEKHGDKIEQGAEKAGELAKKKFGHDEQVDKVVGKIHDAIPNKPDNPSDR